jgi:hypothetical protein
MGYTIGLSIEETDAQEQQENLCISCILLIYSTQMSEIT